MMKLVRMHSLKSKIILIFILTAIVVLMLQVGVFQSLISTIILEQSDTYFKETVNQIGKRVDLQMQQHETTAFNMTENQVLKNYLKDLKDNSINYNIAKYKITREVLKLANLDVLENIYIFPIGKDPINCYYTRAVFEMNSSAKEFLKSTHDGQKIYTMELNPDSYQISVMISIDDEGERLGLLRIDYNLDLLSRILDDVKLGKEGEIYVVRDHTIIYAKEHERVGEVMPVIYETAGSKVTYALQHHDWELTGVVPKTEIVNHINRFNHIFILMVIMILLSILVFALATAHVVLRPLSKILKGMKSIRQGNLNIMLDNNTRDEFSTIIRSFNYMVEKVKSLIGTIYHQQANYRKAEILSLQAKLHPHFLYNTLDMIYWMSVLKDEEEIGEVIVALSDILRYSISHQNEFVTAREDMSQLENYLKIQKMRFEDQLTYIFFIEEEVMELKVPKLIIQPLVENAIKYAFENMKSNGTIWIRGYLEGDDLFFEVTDNGIGMSSRKIRQISASLEITNQDVGLGIRLVHQRAKYIYGEGYGISMESVESEGARIRVKLRKKAEFHVTDLWRDS
jgi:two-component system sensor histidine kinase YesM